MNIREEIKRYKKESNIVAKIELLRKIIRICDDFYYNKDESLITDREYDLLFSQLIELEKQHPELITSDSPTQRVGGEPLKFFENVAHHKPMLSLGNTYSSEEVIDFDRRVKELIPEEEIEYFAELKFDGVAISLIYENLILKTAVTRGDGLVGDDVTLNIKTIRNLPLKAKEVAIDGKLIRNFELRGEVYLNITDFERINAIKASAGEKTYANPRNLASGTLKLLDPKQVAKRPLRIVFYYLDSNDVVLSTQSQNIEIIRKMGFPTSPYSRLCRNLEDLSSFIVEWEKRRFSLPFQIDGVVIKVNSLVQQDTLGTVARSPRWAIAYKYETEKAETILKGITLQVGRTGIVTPVAELNPVHLSGSTISRATLHNADYINELDLRIGDTVLVEKGGEVIPKVVSVVLEKRPNDTQPYNFPEFCQCGLRGKLVRPPGEVAYYCEHPECPWQLRRRIEHFVSRNAMDIEGMGEKVIDQLLTLGYLRNIASIYDLHTFRNELIQLERWGEKKVDNLFEAIENSKKRPLHRLIFALGIRFIGEGAAKILASQFKSLDSLMKATKEELLVIYEIGEKMAQSIIDFFSDPNEIEIINRLRKHNLQMQEEVETITTNTSLRGLTFVLTGELDLLTRNQAKTKIESLGGKVSSSVSKKTSFLVVGKKPGSKYKEAKKLGIRILNENEFLKLLSTNENIQSENGKLF